MSEKKRTDTLSNGVKLGGELFIVPGTSLILEGKFKSGILHAGAGVLGVALLGLPAGLAVAANSFSLSLTGRGLIDNLTSPKKDPRDTSLTQKVKQDALNGLSLEEIKEDILEDVEDIYLETTATCANDLDAATPTGAISPDVNKTPN